MSLSQSPDCFSLHFCVSVRNNNNTTVTGLFDLREPSVPYKIYDVINVIRGTGRYVSDRTTLIGTHRTVEQWQLLRAFWQLLCSEEWCGTV